MANNSVNRNVADEGQSMRNYFIAFPGDGEFFNRNNTKLGDDETSELKAETNLNVSDLRSPIPTRMNETTSTLLNAPMSKVPSDPFVQLNSCKRVGKFEENLHTFSPSNFKEYVKREDHQLTNEEDKA